MLFTINRCSVPIYFSCCFSTLFSLVVYDHPPSWCSGPSVNSFVWFDVYVSTTHLRLPDCGRCMKPNNGCVILGVIRERWIPCSYFVSLGSGAFFTSFVYHLPFCAAALF